MSEPRPRRIHRYHRARTLADPPRHRTGVESTVDPGRDPDRSPEPVGAVPETELATPTSTANTAGTAIDRLPLRTAAQAAQLLAVPESWLRRKAAARAIPCTFLGKHLRFSPADLTAISGQGAEPGRARPPTAHRHPHGPRRIR
jgi:excisionase family DNA binding protein